MPQQNFDSYAKISESKPLKYLFFGILAIVLAGMFYIFKPYIWVFIFAIIVYIGVLPLYERILRLVKHQGTAIAIVGIAVFLLFVVPATFLLIFLGDQTYQLYAYVSEKINSGVLQEIQNNRLVRVVFDYLHIDEKELIASVTGYLQKSAGTIFARITTMVAYPVIFFANLILMVLILLFFLKEGEVMEQKLYQVLPFPEDLQRKVATRLKRVIKILLAGNLFIMTLQGLFLGIGLYFSGFSMVLFWGIVSSIFSLIPVIGTGFIWIPAALYLVFSKDYGTAMFLSIWSYGWYMFFENLVKPWAFGDRLNFNPLLFFFLLLGSIQGFGLAGVIIGPLLLTLFFSLWEIYRIVQKIVPPDESENVNPAE